MRRKLLIIAITGVVVAGVFHQPILRGVGRVLVVDSPLETCDIVVAAGGERRYAVAAEMWHAGHTQQILLLRDRNLPLVRAQIVPAEHAKLREELQQRGVPADRILVTEQPGHTVWGIAERIAEVCQQNPEARVVILTGVFQSRRQQWAIDNTLPLESRQRVFLRAVRDPRFNEADWWRHRLGIKEIVNGYLRLLHVVAIGRPDQLTAVEQLPDLFPGLSPEPVP